MNGVRKLYVCPSFACDLNCPHCEIKNNPKYMKPTDDFWNILYSLQKDSFDSFVLFGGEPTLNEDIFDMVMGSGLITSISTNLVNTSESILRKIVDNKLLIATSWNRKRFSLNQELNWLLNIMKIRRLGSNVDVLITLTDDLVCDEGYKIIEIVLDTLEKTKGVNGVLFEHYVGPQDGELHKRADEFLLKLQQNWRWSFKNLILNRLDNWICDCRDIYTLLPDGTMKNGCPQYTYPNFTKECLSCALADKCKPCILQSECTYPKKLAEYMKNRILN